MSADADVERKRREGIRPAIHQRRGADRPRKGNDRHLGMMSPEATSDPHHGLERPAEKLLLRQYPCPGIEELYGIGASFNLIGEMIDDRVDQQIDQKAEG